MRGFHIKASTKPRISEPLPTKVSYEGHEGKGGQDHQLGKEKGEEGKDEGKGKNPNKGKNRTNVRDSGLDLESSMVLLEPSRSKAFVHFTVTLLWSGLCAVWQF